MLKALFIDLVPYIVDEAKLFEMAWKLTFVNDATKYLENPRIIELMNKDLNNPEIQLKLHNYIVNAAEYEALIKNYAEHLFKLVNAAFEHFSLNENVAKLIADAEKNQCMVIIMSSHTDYLVKLKHLQVFNSNIAFLETAIDAYITADALFKYTSEHNIAVHEFLCLTQESKTIIDMLKNGYFCATINNSDVTDDNLYIINSLSDLDFESIRYNFYESVEDESEDL